MAVDVEGDLGGLVAERRLHLLHAAPRMDQGAREEVAQVVERDRLFRGLSATRRTAADAYDQVSALATRLSSRRNPCYTLKWNCRTEVPHKW